MMTSILEQYDERIAEQQCKLTSALSEQRALRQQARDKGINTAVSSIANLNGSGEYGCLKLVVNGISSALYWHNKEVYSQVYSHDIRKYCPGENTWESELFRWQKALALQLDAKRQQLTSLQTKTYAAQRACRTG